MNSHQLFMPINFTQDLNYFLTAICEYKPYKNASLGYLYEVIMSKQVKTIKHLRRTLACNQFWLNDTCTIIKP